MPTPLEQAIARTAAWFSMFETPVTVFELWKWMLKPDRPYSLEETHAAFDGEWLRERLVERDGMWTLRPEPSNGGVEKHVQYSVPDFERRTRFLDATRKFKKLRRAMRFVRLVPGVVGVAAGNTLAWWNTRPDSDIDLLVVTKPGMIWLARLLVVTPFALLGKRPGAATVDPFCFSFFVTTDALDFSSLRLVGGDPYLAYWTRSLVPVLDRGGIFDRLASENRWADSVLPHGMASTTKLWKPSLSPQSVPQLSCGTGSRLENFARKIQLRRFPPKIRAIMNVDSRVVANDRTLKFHENDRREEYRDRLNALCPAPASPISSSS